jgi:uncharacterized protein involved in exopolysaccharide biosynthesis
MAADKLAQDQLVQKAQADVIAAQTAQRAAEARVDQETQKREQVDAVSRDSLVGGLHNLEAAVRTRLLSAAVDHPAQIQGAEPGAARDPRLSDLLARFDASFDRLISACQREYELRAGILSLEPQVNP